MELTAGQFIGPYEVVSPLGAGGMGEVYRAHDAKLKRDVALKILPAHVSRDLERLARFEREARVLASLNHPHIATIEYPLHLSTELACLSFSLPTRGKTIRRLPVQGVGEIRILGW